MTPERVLRAEERRVLQVMGKHPPAPVWPPGREPCGRAEGREEHDQEYPRGLREAAHLARGSDRNVDQARHYETNRDQAKEYDGEQHGGSLAADLPGSRSFLGGRVQETQGAPITASNIHGTDESVELASIVDGARTLARFMAAWYATPGDDR